MPSDPSKYLRLPSSTLKTAQLRRHEWRGHERPPGPFQEGKPLLRASLLSSAPGLSTACVWGDSGAPPRQEPVRAVYLGCAFRSSMRSKSMTRTSEPVGPQSPKESVMEGDLLNGARPSHAPPESPRKPRGRRKPRPGSRLGESGESAPSRPPRTAGGRQCRPGQGEARRVVRGWPRPRSVRQRHPKRHFAGAGRPWPVQPFPSCATLQGSAGGSARATDRRSGTR